jgi:hypothetical protein
LTETWREAFLQHMQVSPEHVLTSHAERRKIQRQKMALSSSEQYDNQNNPSDCNAENLPVEKKPKPEPPRSISAGAKRLAKVNTKGMGKMMSFFTVKKKE